MVSIREGRYILFHVVLFLSVSVCTANLRNLQYRLSHNLTFFSFFNVCDVVNVVFSMFVCYPAAFCQLCFYNKDWTGLDL